VKPFRRIWSLFALCACLWTLSAEGAVEKRGVWPSGEVVSLSLSDVPRSEAVRRLAEEAGFSLVQEGLGQEPVSVSVRGEPAEKVLVMLLGDRDYVVERDGSLVSVRAVTPSVQSAAKPVATPTEPDEDLFVPERGHVGPDQVVRDVFVLGSVLIEGTVTGSVLVIGGEARFAKGARVREDVIALRGTLDIEESVEIGEVTVLLGTLKRGDGPARSCLACGGEEKKEEPWPELFETLFGNLLGTVIGWLVGAVLLALVPHRVEILRAEMERRPLRNMGLGLLGGLGLLVTVATLVLTLIGIPLAVALLFGSVVIGYLGSCVLPLAIGRHLLRERTESPYVQLAAGCALLFCILSIPVLGDLLSFLGALLVLGALLRTRGAHTSPSPVVIS